MKTLDKNKIVVKDSESGAQFPINFFIPENALALADAATAQAWLHELLQLEQQMQEYETAGTFFDKCFFTSPAPRGKRYIGYKQMVREGQAQLVSRSATDFPVIDTGATIHTAPICPIASAYTVNYFESQEYAVLNGAQSLDAEGAMASRESIIEQIDYSVWFGGKSPDGLILTGFIDYLNGGGATQVAAGTSIYKKALSTGTSGNTWALKTGKEIYEEASDLLYQVFLNNKGKRMANKLLMGLTNYGAFSTKTLIDENNGINTTMTAEDAIRKKYPNLVIVVVPWLDAITHTNSNETWSAANAVVAFNDQRTNYSLVVDPYTTLRPYENKGFVTKVNNFGLVSSFMLKRPTDFVYVKGT